VVLSQLNVSQLRERWRDLFGEETKQRHRQYLVKRIAWELQRRESGEELSPEALKRLDELQDEFRNSPPRTWFKGARHNRSPIKTSAVRRQAPAGDAAKSADRWNRAHPRLQGPEAFTVTARGPREFEWNGQIYTSLSAAAKAITGSHCSGNRVLRAQQEGRRGMSDVQFYQTQGGRQYY
jgi:hypothetical protein